MCFIGCRVSYLLLNGCNFSKAFTFIRCSVDKKDDLSNDTKAYYVSKNEIGEIISFEMPDNWLLMQGLNEGDEWPEEIYAFHI